MPLTLTTCHLGSLNLSFLNLCNRVTGLLPRGLLRGCTYLALGRPSDFVFTIRTNDWQWPERRGRGITGKRRGKVKSRNMSKGSMDKDNGGEDWKWKVGGGVGQGRVMGDNGDNCNWTINQWKDHVLYGSHSRFPVPACSWKTPLGDTELAGNLELDWRRLRHQCLS